MLAQIFFNKFIFCRPEDLHRIRVEHMERQLANLTGLVQKALVHNPQIGPGVQQQQYLQTLPSGGGQYRNGKSDVKFTAISCGQFYYKKNSLPFHIDVENAMSKLERERKARKNKQAKKN